MSFDRPTPLEWRESAQKALKDRPLESLIHLDADQLTVRPLYGQATGVEPIFAPRPSHADGRAWDLRTLVEGDKAEDVNAALLDDLQGGAASVMASGAFATDAGLMARALEGIALELATVALDAGLEGSTAAEALAGAAKGSPRAKLAFNMDPVSAFAEAGGAGRPLSDLLQETAQTAARHALVYPEARLFLAGGRVVHEAGGTAAQELGFTAASAIAVIDASLSAGVTLERTLSSLVLSISVDQTYFDALAKIRALRLIWKTLSSGWGHETPALIEARSSRRMLSARDPWPNLLRLTAAGFAGAVGGADIVILDGFTRASGTADGFARRQARNTQIVLMQEANLGRVDDPAAGSWFLDSRTRDLATAGWTEAQRIAREGGLVASLEGGAIQARIGAARAAWLGGFRDGRDQIIGVTRYVDPDVRPFPVQARKTSAPPGDAAAPACRVDPLTPVRAASLFEETAQ